MKLTNVLICTLIASSVFSIKTKPAPTIVRCGTPTPPPPEPSVHVEVHHEAQHTINGKGQSHVHSVTNGQVKQSGSEDINGGYRKPHKEAGRLFKRKFFNNAKEHADRVMNRHGFGGGNTGGIKPLPIAQVVYNIIGYKRKDLSAETAKGVITVEGDRLSVTGLCNNFTVEKGKGVTAMTRRMCIGTMTGYDSYVSGILAADDFAFTQKKALKFKIKANGEWIQVQRQ